MAKLNFEVDRQPSKKPLYHGPLIFIITKEGIAVQMQREWCHLRTIARGIEEWIDNKVKRVFNAGSKEGTK